MENIWISLLVCSLVSGATLVIARKVRRRTTPITYAVAQWALFSFVSFLLVLIVNAVGLDWYYFDDVVISGFYTYVIEDSRFFALGGKKPGNE